MGILYVVATPVGNLEDISLRAIRILMTVPVIACEDTRHTGQLIKRISEGFKKETDFRPRFISVRDWNEADVVEKIIKELENNDVALVSDAGTPLLSDPGFKVVRAARAAGYMVSPIPGAFAGAAALSAAGLPTNIFKFWGFLPKKWELESEVTHIIYEAPIRLNNTLHLIKERYPSAKIVIANELTKVHEKIFEYQGEELNLKGEATVLIYIPKD